MFKDKEGDPVMTTTQAPSPIAPTVGRPVRGDRHAEWDGRGIGVLLVHPVLATQGATTNGSKP